MGINKIPPPPHCTPYVTCATWSAHPPTQLPLTALQLPVAPQVTRGAPLLPAVKPLLQVAVQIVPLVLVLPQLNTPLAGLPGLAEHTGTVGPEEEQQSGQREQQGQQSYLQ
jgi:hypothetical protein